MTRSRPPLSELVRRARSLRTDAALSRLVIALRDDPRRGAAALAGRIERRIESRRAERRRVARLFAFRRRLFAGGLSRVAGVDEVGVGPLAGPVVAAAVILPKRVELAGLDDSKRLSAEVRQHLDAQIRSQALAVSVAEVSPAEIDRVNVLRATLEAMRRAVVALDPPPDHIVVDARTIPGVVAPQTPIVGGDARDGSIAAASIVAKVHRDAIMRRLDRRYPGYGFARHKGYGTPEHLASIEQLGPSPVHRRSFAPVSQLSLV